MNEEMVQDIQNRINTVVNRYRDTTGRDTYRLKYRYSNEIVPNNDLVQMLLTFWGGIAIAIIFAIPDAKFKLFGIGMLVMLILLLLVTGRFKKVKTWKHDDVSEEDLLYLCENSFLKEKINLDLVNGERLTYTCFDRNIKPYTIQASDRLVNQKRQELIKRVNDLQPALIINKDE